MSTRAENYIKKCPPHLYESWGIFHHSDKVVSYLPQVHLSYIYPNDHTRLTHTDPQGSCFYPEKPSVKRDPPLTNDKYYDPKWSQTFDVKHIDFEEKRNDGVDLKCEMKGNLLLSSSETLPLVQAFMNKLNEKHPGYGPHFLFFSLTCNTLVTNSPVFLISGSIDCRKLIESVSTKR